MGLCSKYNELHFYRIPESLLMLFSGNTNIEKSKKVILHVFPRLIGWLILVPLSGLAQELPLLLEHPGTFEILSRADYTSPECKFTKNEVAANLQKIILLVNTVRKNSVLSEMKGFDGRARIYNVGCKYDGSYGIPARISFEFASWFQKKDGTPARGFIEPPEWSLYMNKLLPGGYPFSSDNFSTKPDYFTVPIKKETLEPGIDVYDGECYAIYDPGRPPYWLPVTVKEAFDAVIASLKKNTDPVQQDYLMKYIDQEWEAIPEADRDKPATLSGMISRVGTNPAFPPIMKVNLAYWDKNLPRSDIQFIYFRMIGNRQLLRSNTALYLEKNSISYHEARFEESLDIKFVRSLKSLIRN
jgi:hypothetical protein